MRDATKNGKMRQFRPFLVQKVSGTCWHPFDLVSAQYRSAFVDDWQMYRVPRSLDEIEVIKVFIVNFTIIWTLWEGFSTPIIRAPLISQAALEGFPPTRRLSYNAYWRSVYLFLEFTIR